MTNYRNPKYIERYEDVVFELDTALITPGNGLHQTKTNCYACGDLVASENFNVSLKACLQIVGTTLRVVCEVPRITENQVDG